MRAHDVVARSVCARPKSHLNHEDERVAVQVFQRTYRNEIKLRFVFTRLNEKTSIEQRGMPHTNLMIRS